MGTATKKNKITSYDDLPITLTVEQVGDVLRISRSKAYELVHEKGFPTVKIGRRLLVTKISLMQWLQNVGDV